MLMLLVFAGNAAMTSMPLLLPVYAMGGTYAYISIRTTALLWFAV